jgi:hypothetical protein
LFPVGPCRDENITLRQTDDRHVGWHETVSIAAAFQDVRAHPKPGLIAFRRAILFAVGVDVLRRHESLPDKTGGHMAVSLAEQMRLAAQDTSVARRVRTRVANLSKTLSHETKGNVQLGFQNAELVLVRNDVPWSLLVGEAIFLWPKGVTEGGHFSCEFVAEVAAAGLKGLVEKTSTKSTAGRVSHTNNFFYDYVSPMLELCHAEGVYYLLDLTEQEHRSRRAAIFAVSPHARATVQLEEAVYKFGAGAFAHPDTGIVDTRLQALEVKARQAREGVVVLTTASASSLGHGPLA